MNKKIKIIFVLIGVLFLFLFSYALLKKLASLSAGKSSGFTPFAVQAPDFTLQDLNGEWVSLSSYRGKQGVILFFWAVRCDICRDEIKVMHYRYPEIFGGGWEVLAIDILESANKVKSFLRYKHPPFKILFDRDADVAYRYDIQGLPTFIFVDKKGNTIFKDNFFPYLDYKQLISE